MAGSLTASERETILTTSDADKRVTIWTAQRTVLTALRKKPEHFTETASGFHGTTEWATFSTVTDVWSVSAGTKRRGTPRPNLRAQESSSMTDSAEQLTVVGVVPSEHRHPHASAVIDDTQRVRA